MASGAISRPSIRGLPSAWTGCDTTVRADVGVAWRGESVLAYAALASWPAWADLDDHPVDLMNALGRRLAADLGREAD